MIDVSEATNEILQRLKAKNAAHTHEADLSISFVSIQFLLSRGVIPEMANRQCVQISPQFMDAAWELVRIRVLRPGMKHYTHSQSQSSEQYFSVTAYGAKWLEYFESENFIPADLSSFTTIIEKYRPIFGDGYMQRAVEAYKCYKSGSWLGCCAMSGAAAESILLALAIAKTKNEDDVLKKYRAASGRKTVTDLLLGKKSEGMRREFDGLTFLLHSWRDDAAHGTALQIGKAEADHALLLLMRSAKYAADNYAALTQD